MIYEDLLTTAMLNEVDPTITRLGFVGWRRRLRWRRADLEMRVVPDSKAFDPYAGGAFTIEFERSPNQKFERKLGGRVRLYQLLDENQSEEYLALHNLIAKRLTKPSAEYLEWLPRDLWGVYLKTFEVRKEIGPDPFMRFATSEDATAWTRFIADNLINIIERAQGIDPGTLILGKKLNW